VSQYSTGSRLQDLLEDLIEHVAGLYVGPNCDIETDKEVVEQP